MEYASTILNLALGIEIDTVIDPDHTNRPNAYLENLAAVLVRQLIGAGLLSSGLTVNESTGRIQVPDVSYPILGIADGKFFLLGPDREVASSVTAGGANGLVDSARSEAAGFWVDAWVVFTSGDSVGVARKVTAFDPVSGTLTWDVPLSTTFTAGDTYVVSFFYIQSRTLGAVNYVYGRATTNTVPGGVLQWVANNTGVKAAGDILVATVTLDGSGLVTAVDTDPDGADRSFFPGAGQVHMLYLTGTIADLEPAASVEITRAHSDLILLGPIASLVDQEDCTIEIVDGWQPDQVTFIITNNHPYSIPVVSYSITRKGRKLVVV